MLSDGTGVEIAGNRIGVEVDGTSAAGNGLSGIRLGTSARNNVIGADSQAGENAISNSGGDAIAIVGAASGNQVKGNTGSANADLFIDLGDDGTGNPGLVQGGVLPPAITAAGPRLARGTAPAGATVRVFSKSTAGDGELEAYLGSATADGSGAWRVDYASGPTPLPNMKRVVATQSDPTDGTSELSDGALTDAIAPGSPTIQSGPGGLISDATPTFTFSGEASTALECRIDSAAPVACDAGNYTAAALSEGAHTFHVTATDLAGNTSVPASRSFTVDTIPPETTIASGPKGPTNNSSPSFGFSSSEPGSSFACRLDGGAWSACSSPKAFSNLPDGLHSFGVRATDSAANTDPSAASRSFIVDTKVEGSASAKATQKQKGNRIVVKVKVQANEDLSADASGKVKLRKTTYKLKPQSKSVASGEQKTLKLKPKKGKDAKKIAKALKKGKKANAKLTVELSDGAGNAESEKLSVTLKG